MITLEFQVFICQMLGFYFQRLKNTANHIPGQKALLSLTAVILVSIRRKF